MHRITQTIAAAWRKLPFARPPTHFVDVEPDKNDRWRWNIKTAGGERKTLMSGASYRSFGMALAEATDIVNARMRLRIFAVESDIGGNGDDQPGIGGAGG